jgi:N-acetylmuramoyl-L-alanine amidase
VIPVRFVLKAVLTVVLVLGFAAAAPAAAKDEYARGVSAFNSLLGNEKRAGLRAEWLAVMKHFERSLASEPKGAYAPKCMFFLGRSFEELARRSFAKADRTSALDAYDRVLTTFPKHGWADDAMFRKGMVWLELAKDPVQAEGFFKGVVAAYPKGDMVPKAREMLAQMAGAPVAAPAPSSRPAPEPAAKAAPVKGESTLMGIRHWSSSDYTRVVMDVTGDVKYERALVEKAKNGNKQLQITLQRTDIAADVMPERTIGDGILSRILVSPESDGGALITFDLMQMDHYRVFTLPEPYRVVLDIYATGGNGVRAKEAAATRPEEPSGKEEPELDHVQRALAELEAKSAAKKDAPAVKKVPEPAKAQKQAKGGKPSGPPAQESAVKEETPQIAVTPKQKKYSGSLVEQLGLKVRTIMIDAGHGGKDPGAVANGLEEKDINLRMARILGRELQQQGFEVHYTRTRDTFIPLEERTAMANAKNADLFISLHCNAIKDHSVKGLEVYYLNLATDAQAVRVAARENGVSAKKISDMQFILSDLMLNSKINESRQMASLVEQETLRAMRPRYSLSSHGAKGAFFYVLTGARMPSILVEMGYLTNPDEAARLNTDAYLASMARGLASGVVAYKKKLERFALNGTGKS